ncbi:Dabb family protein [Mycolicibacterium vaccae]|uniref:Stress responsive alpha-beta barrel domain-containing protein n=1 Tax=Mycolicibacterium vaccae ATCC 25954 TaxID=1194972 RepID=K0UEG4_MYCVA|nr:Dabb family protein [Mycolicibacterium vaccae]ANI38862.1 stress responsive protein [Mycolicibacterium vaccae 95051]EJZ05281.1 stress responsive alpha-beta barrel domain-containing protein [Mycolicibacterium vaccae ATCC 25954]
MYNVTRLIDVAETERHRVQEALQELAEQCGASRHLVAPTLPGSRNGGDLLLHLRFDDARNWSAVADRFDEALHDPAVTRVNGVGYHGLPQTISDRAPGTVYRTLLLRVAPGTGADTLSRFEADLKSLPGFVSTISAWQLSRPDHTIGVSEWTHVFEQEFTDADGIMGAYLMHPIHWAVVDQWFDPECPNAIVRERVCHSFCLDSTWVLR